MYRELALAESQAMAEGEGEDAGGMMTVDETGNQDPDDDGARDLDEDVPDADEGGEWSDAMTEDEELDPTTGEGVTMLEDEAAGEDLDDGVPEAGEYEHTDTEVEDSSEEEEAVGIVRGPVMGTFRTGTGQFGGRVGAGLLGSSVFGSSPVRVEERGGRRSSGRGRGREN